MKYYIAENGQQAGPFEPNELMAHGLTVNSLVWCEGMPAWTSASQVPELMALLSGQTFNPGNINTQMPQMPQAPTTGDPIPLPQVPPFGGQQQQPTQPTTYGQGTTNQPYAQPQYGPNTNQPNQRQVMPKTWLTESIIVTVLSALCCCNPVGLLTGIFSIFKANSSKSKYTRGDATGSATDAASAKKWMIITIIIGVVWTGIQAYKMMTDPTFLQQIQEGAGMGNITPLFNF